MDSEGKKVQGDEDGGKVLLAVATNRGGVQGPHPLTESDSRRSENPLSARRVKLPHPGRPTRRHSCNYDSFALRTAAVYALAKPSLDCSRNRLALP
jgi:hypothetical protein